MSSESYPFLKKSTEITAQQWGNNPTIGRNCMIGAGSVVTKDIPSGVVAYVNPCKVIRENDKWEI